MKIKNTRNDFGPYLTAADAVIGAAVITVIGTSAGLWLDSKLHTTPLFMLVLLFCSMILGLARMVIKAAKANDQFTEEKNVDKTNLNNDKSND